MRKRKKTLSALRTNIDLVDTLILKLLIKRALLAQQTTDLKGDVVFDPKREGEILKRVVASNTGPISDNGLQQIYKEVLSACREVQDPMLVTYLGPQGSNTNEAAIKVFGQSTTLMPQGSISDVFDSVERGETNFGVVPIENSLEGPIGETLDRLTDSSVVIDAEISQNIEHCLLSKEKNLRKIKKIISHPQALSLIHI